MTDAGRSSAAKTIPSWRDQVRANAVALVSIALAVATLAYTTWRNEATEHHRNVRAAGFQILRDLSDLQVLADHAHYEGDSARGNPIAGWGLVGAVEDLAVFMGPDVRRQADTLKLAWQADWDELGTDRAAAERLAAAIADTRTRVRAELEALD